MHVNVIVEDTNHEKMELNVHEFCLAQLLKCKADSPLMSGDSRTRHALNCFALFYLCTRKSPPDMSRINSELITLQKDCERDHRL